MEKNSSFVVRFSEALVKNKIFNEVEANSFVQEFRGRAKGNVVDFLLEEGLVEVDNILKVLSSVYNVPSFDVRGYFFNHELLLLFPQDFLRENVVIPLEIDEDIMTVVMSNPEDEETLELFGNYANYNVNVFVGIKEHILDAIDEYYDEDVISAETEEQKSNSDNEEDDSDIVDYM